MKKNNFSEENIKLIILKNESINSSNFKLGNNYNSYIFNFRINKIYYIKRLSLILLILYLFYLDYLDYLLFLYNKKGNESELYINIKNETYLKLEYIKKFNSFINLCKKGRFDNSHNYPLVKNPLISVIIPIYNGGKYLFYSLRSIQNQQMKKIEIILIDDNSTDNSLNIIKNYMDEDKRIRLIKNNKNRKILYSKSIGALNSKGKYIIELDQDDMFIRKDSFDILYYEAEKNDLDLVHIRDFSKKSFKFSYLTKVNFGNDEHLIFPQNTNYKNQPKLKNKIYIENNIYLLWGLLIKSDLYKNAIYHLWPIIMNYQLVFHEDYAISFMLIILAKRYKYLNKFALLHLIHSKSASNNYKDNKNYYLSVLFVSHIIIEYHLKNHPKDIIILINYINLFMECFKYGKKYYPNLFQYIINNILNNDYLPIQKKIDIINQIDNNNNNLVLNSLYYYYNNLKNYKSLSLFKENTNINFVSNILFNISIIIYCTEFKFLRKTIYSLLEQIYINIEIIIIYDNIEMKDLYYIKNFIKYYKFIKLINNKINKGIIYSISLGVLKSTGKYILYLQSGYILFKENFLNDLYTKIDNNNLDILEYNLINNEYLTIYKCLHIKTNIYLNSIKYNKLYKEIDQEKELLFNKIIKADLFKQIINEYKFINFKNCIYNYYDNIFLFSLMHKNIKFGHIDLVGVIQNNKDINELNLTKIMNDKEQKINDSIFYINYIFENTNNTFEGKKYALNEFLVNLSIIFNKFNNISLDAIELLKKFNNSKLINNNDKFDLNFYYNSLIN